MAETSGDEMPRIYNIRQEFFGPRRLAVRIVQDVVLQLGETAVDFPPMQAPASFSLTTCLSVGTARDPNGRDGRRGATEIAGSVLFLDRPLFRMLPYLGT
jgi:hypothetical protein